MSGRKDCALEPKSNESGNAKLSKTGDKELKKLEKLEKKKELKKMADEEMANLTARKGPTKVTRFELELRKEASAKSYTPKSSITKVGAIEENVNRIMAATEVASNVDEAIDIFSSFESRNFESDHHLEKKARKAYQLFENKRLNQLRVENPSLRHNQLLDIVNKEWKRSSENPFNRSS